MDLINVLEEKGLNLLAEAVNVKGEKWGIEWIKNNSSIQSGDITSATEEDIEKLKNAQNVKVKNLVDIIKDNGKSKEESRTKRFIRATLALIIVIATISLFYKVIFPVDHIDKDTVNVINVIKENNEIIMYILGALSAIVTQIVSFYFGSSEDDSKTK